MAQTPGSASDKGRKYELSVVAFIASSLSQNENVVDYRIYSNLTKYYPFDDVVVEVDFKGSEGSQIYAIQTKSGNYKFDFWKYLYGYRTIIGEVQEDKLQVWHFAAKNMEYFQQKLSKIKQSTKFGCKECSNTDSKDILRETRYYKLHPKNSNLAQHTNFFKNFYLFFDQPDTQKIHEIIAKRWKIDDSLHSYIEKYFANSNNNGLDKKSFEHEILRNRLYNYIVMPTKAIDFQHTAVDEWNKLTLSQDVTIVLNETNIEEDLYGCVLRNKHISYVINIHQWNHFVNDEGKLDGNVKNHFKETPWKVETLKDLIFQKWVDDKVPLILRTDASLPVLKEFQHLNKKYIIIVSDITNRSEEIEHYGLNVFKHLGDVDADTLMKNIFVSLQGREPISLYEIINIDETLKQGLTCVDVISLMRPRKANIDIERFARCNDYIFLIIETTNPQSSNYDEQQPIGRNMVSYCEPNTSCERYTEIRANSRFQNYKIVCLRMTADTGLSVVSGTNEGGTIQNDEECRGLECFFIDQNGKSIYYMNNGDTIPIIGEIPIHVRWRYVTRYLREGIKINEQITSGDTSNKFSIKYNDKSLLTETDLFRESSGRIVVVTGEPGMGKTALLHSLFHLCQSKYYVIPADLAHHQHALFNNNLKSLEDVLRLSDDRCRPLPYYGFLKNLHACSSRLVIILDSFDEIVATCEKQVLQLIKNLQEADSHKIIIASRLTALNALLTNDVGARIYKIEGLDTQSAEDYSGISNLDTNARGIPLEFLTNPLYLNMLRSILEDVLQLKVINKWILYEYVVNSKMENYLKQNPLDEIEKQSILKNHQLLAMKVLLGNIPGYNSESIPDLERSNFIRVGFITHFHNDNPVFVHRTFAEYFVTKWLLANVGKESAKNTYKHLLDNNLLNVLNIHSEGFPLHKAILDQDMDAVLHLSKNDANYLQEVDDLGRNAFHLAVIHSPCWEESDILKFLSSRMRQDRVNATDKFNCTPLHYSVMTGNNGIVRFLLENCNFPQLYAGRTSETTIFHMSLRTRNEDVTKMILERLNINLGTSKRLKIINAMLKKKDKEAYTPLEFAVKYGSKDLIKILIDYYISMDLVRNLDSTYFHNALIRRDKEIITFLLQHGANPNYMREVDRMPLEIAIKNGDDDIVRILLAHKANINVEYENTPLRCAITTQNMNIIRMLLQSGADVDYVDRSNRTPLIYAIMTENKDIVQLLLEYKADVNLKSNNGYIPLCVAIETQKLEVIELLLQNDAFIDCVDSCGRTPLVYAIKTKLEEIVQMLLNCGADVNCKDKHGRTPIYTAIKVKDANIVQMLLNNQADVNSTDKYSRSPLLIAVSRGNIQIVKMLLDKSANVNFKNEHGFAALKLAEFRKDAAMVKLLMDYGAHDNAIMLDGEIFTNVRCQRKRSVLERLLKDDVGGYPPSASSALCDLNSATYSTEVVGYHINRFNFSEMEFSTERYLYTLDENFSDSTDEFSDPTDELLRSTYDNSTSTDQSLDSIY
ncbi:hypothetical protein Trydic_g19789 [Trypoxylus dichotomus]